jgi:hypothetical protein
MAKAIPPTRYYAARYFYGKFPDPSRRYLYSFSSRLARIQWVAGGSNWPHQRDYREPLKPSELQRAEYAMEMRIVEDVRPRVKSR